MSTQILLVDDHAIVRQGLRSLIDKQPDMKVVGEAGDGPTGLKLVKEYAPDVVIMDIGMPGMNGIEATSQILAISPSTRVIGLSMHGDNRFVTEMLRAGASGYMPKDCAFEELVQGIHTVTANKMYLSPSITHTVMRKFLGQLDNADYARFSDCLTNREREVLQLLARGRSTREMAGSLGISVKTVETHRQHITEKLNLRTLAELIKYAIREGITSVDE